jgi:regulatory protein
MLIVLKKPPATDLVAPAETLDLGAIMQQAASALRKNRLPQSMAEIRRDQLAEAEPGEQRSSVKAPAKRASNVKQRTGFRVQTERSEQVSVAQTKQPALSADQAYVKGLALLAGRELSAHELEMRLKKAGADATCTQSALMRLQEDRLQSDSRFAESRSNGLANRGKGPRAIAAKLSAAGVDKGLGKSTIANLEVDWLENARRLVLRKFGENAPTDQKSWAKRARFLASRGFDGSTVQKALRPPTDDEC